MHYSYRFLFFFFFVLADKDKDTDSISSLDASNTAKPEPSPSVPSTQRVTDEMPSNAVTSQTVDRDHLEDVLSSFPAQATPEVEQEGPHLNAKEDEVDEASRQDVQIDGNSKEVLEVFF